MNIFRKATLLGGLLLALSSSHVLADSDSKLPFTSSNEDQFFMLGIEHFAWDEYNNDQGYAMGNSVSDFGARLHLGIIYGTDWERQSGDYYRSSHDIHAGFLRYKGKFSDYPDADIKGYSMHAGYKYDRQYGYRWRLSPQLSIAPTATLGIDVWSSGMIHERVKDSTTGQEEDIGFHEIYFAPYAGLGISASWHIDDHRRVTLEAGKQHPLIVVQHKQDVGLLYPEPQWNDTLSLEYSDRKESGKFARLYYENKTYGKSDVNSDGHFQPESDQETIGVMMGWKF